jgi:iron complex transport system substrate-binding protein
MRKWLILALVSLVVLSVLTGCGQAKSPVSAPEKKTVTVNDAAGRQAQVPYPAKRVVCLASDAAEVICALGAEDQVVAVSDTLKSYPIVKERFANTPGVGNFSEPSVEKILEVRPDVVLGYKQSLDNKIAEKIQAAGVPFIVLTCNDMRTFVQDVKNLGCLLGKEKEADDFITFINNNLKKITEVIQKVPLSQRPRIYVEGFQPFTTYGKESPSANIVELAGGANIAENEPTANPKINPEWVVKQNPDIIVKVVTSDKTLPDVMRQERENIVSRPGFKEIKAVKDDRIYVIGWKVYTGARAVIGAAYLAKWFHPDLFKDVDPEAIHREMLKKFYNEELRGVWVYPEK